KDGRRAFLPQGRQSTVERPPSKVRREQKSLKVARVRRVAYSWAFYCRSPRRDSGLEGAADAPSPSLLLIASVVRAALSPPQAGVVRNDLTPRTSQSTERRPHVMHVRQASAL